MWTETSPRRGSPGEGARQLRFSELHSCAQVANSHEGQNYRSELHIYPASHGGPGDAESMASRPVSTYNPSALAPGKWHSHVPGPGLEDQNMGVFPDGAERAPREYLVHLLTHTHPSLQIQHKPREMQPCQVTERARDEPRLESLP